MASNTETVSRIEYLDPADIAPHPHNPRHSLGDLKELTASIAEQGVLEAIVVEPFPEGEVPEDGRRWLLIHGHRRLAAAQAAGRPTIKAEILPASSSLEEQVARMLVENLQRAGLTAVEEGDGYQELLDLGWDAATIAQRVSRPKRKVTDLVKVAGLPESARERISEGQLTLEDASRMAKFAKDADAMEELQEQSGVGKWAFESALARIEKRKQQEREIAKQKKDLRAKGIKIVSADDLDDFPEYSDLEDLPASATGTEDLDEDATDVEWLRASVDGHASCPGAFAWIESGSWGTLVRHACSQPYRHDRESTPDRPGTDVELDEKGEAELVALEERRKQREQDERDRAEMQLQLAAAGVARRHFLGDVLVAPEAGAVAKELLLRQMKTVLAGKTEWAMKQQRILGEVVLPNATQDSLDKPGLPDRIRKALEGMTVAQLVLVAELDLAAETSLSSRASAWQQRSEYSGPGFWVRDLEKVWGYSWSDFEQGLINGDPEDAS